MHHPETTLKNAVHIAASSVLKLAKDEQILIITNPGGEAETIARALYLAALDCGASPVLILQPVKTQFDFAEPAVIAAFHARPQVLVSISTEKLGKDMHGIANPYKFGEEEYDHIFHLLLYGEKSCRSFWSPSTTLESFVRTVPIDYSALVRSCVVINGILDSAESAHISAPGGTDITIGLRGRKAQADDGDFSAPGKGGNLPAGESFISPENGTAHGTIVFDGSISLYKGDIVIKNPIKCGVKDGCMTDISGAEEAKALQETVAMAERDALDYEKTGRLPNGQGAEYAKNAR
ncbi:MAG: aminopeptidase, partial [Treponema sp.]|nr:aminopeptidase [Treponema sp.]